MPGGTSDLVIHYPEIDLNYEHWKDSLTTLHQTTARYLGIIREEQGLKKAERLLTEKCFSKTGFNLEPSFFELQSMVHLAAMIAKAALTRTESRGGHYRSDFPNPDPKWQKHIYFKRNKIEVSE
jgi:L-aspartate oxidase